MLPQREAAADRPPLPVRNYARGRGREALRDSLAPLSLASMFPNDDVSPTDRADIRALLRGTGDRRTEPTCRCTTLRAMKPPS